MDILSEDGLISNRVRREEDQRPTSATPPFPYTAYFDIGNLCNHSCVFCAYPKMTRPGRRMSSELLRRLIREAYELGTREIAFHCGGEPFMSPDLEEHIRFAKEIGHQYVFMTTNGTIATEQRIRTCIDNGLDSIKFSINAADRETYKQIHGSDDFDKVMRVLRFTREYRDAAKARLHIGVSLVMIDHEVGSNAATRQQMQELVGPYTDELMFYDAVSANGQMIGLGPMDIEAPCRLPFIRLHVSSEGYVRLCCSDYQNYVSLVDLNKTSLKDAWSSEIFVSVRQRHLDDKLEGTLCFNCIYNVNTPIEPMVPELATKVDKDFFVLQPVK